MQAVQGFYDNGVITLEGQAPVRRGKIFVFFPASNAQEHKLSNEEAMSLFHKFTGSIDRTIDFDKERDEYLNEKYDSLS